MVIDGLANTTPQGIAVAPMYSTRTCLRLIAVRQNSLTSSIQRIACRFDLKMNTSARLSARNARIAI